MAELFIEILTEEVPFSEHKNQENAVLGFLDERRDLFGCQFEIASSTTRFVIYLKDLANEVVFPSKRHKGPPALSERIAVEGFLNRFNISETEATIEGGFYIFNEPEKKVSIGSLFKDELLSELFFKISSKYSKTMIWNDSRQSWIRPIKNILILLNGKLLSNYKFAGLISTHSTIISGKCIEVQNYNHYLSLLEQSNIILSFKDRVEKIKSTILEIETKYNLRCISPSKLFSENAYLSDFPNIKYAKFDLKYLSLPSRVLVESLQKNQKYFLFEDTKTNQLSNYFAICINGKFQENVIENIIDGNKTVLNARLEDAFYYIKIDTRKTLSEHLSSLKNIAFHKNVGSVFDRIKRMHIFLDSIERQIDSGILNDLKAAITLCKADLGTEMTQSFPELQGYIGAFYAKKEGINETIADAIESHYHLGTETISTQYTDLALILALIEKWEKVATLLMAGENPTSSRDPFSIRRDVLAIIRIILEGKLHIVLNFANNIGNFNSEIPVESVSVAPDKFRKIFFDRLDFFLKENFERSCVKHVLEAYQNANMVDLHQIIEKIKIFSQFKTELENYSRVSNFLKSKEVTENLKLSSLSINTELLSPFEGKLVEVFSNQMTFEEYIQNSYLISEFFENFLIIDKNSSEITQNRIVILNLINNKSQSFAIL